MTWVHSIIFLSFSLLQVIECRKFIHSFDLVKVHWYKTTTVSFVLNIFLVTEHHTSAVIESPSFFTSFHTFKGQNRVFFPRLALVIRNTKCNCNLYQIILLREPLCVNVHTKHSVKLVNVNYELVLTNRPMRTNYKSISYFVYFRVMDRILHKKSHFINMP